MSDSAAQNIPVVDLARFLHGDRADQAAFVQALGDALADLGFVAVARHGVDARALAGTYAELKHLLDQTTEFKKQFETPANGRQRGYTAFGVEHAKDQAVGDLKEFWHIGPELSPNHPLAGRVPPNLWPADFAAFKAHSLALYASLFTTAQALIRAIARYLGAEEAAFLDMIDGGNTILRLIRYPAPGEVAVPEGAVWAAAHEDINLITLLPEATEPGLQLLQRDGTWLDINPVPGQLIADTGDMMQRLTNGLLPSTTHRVLQPRHATGPRYSIPFFVHPRPDFVLAPLPQCTTAERPRRWPDITAEGYLTERLHEIGLNRQEAT